MLRARFEIRARSLTLGLNRRGTRARHASGRIAADGLPRISLRRRRTRAGSPRSVSRQRRTVVRRGRVERRTAGPWRRRDHRRRAHAGHRPGHRHRIADDPRHGHRRAPRHEDPRRLDPRVGQRRIHRRQCRTAVQAAADHHAVRRQRRHAASGTGLEVPRRGQRRHDRPARRGPHLVGSAGIQHRARTRHRAARPAGRLAPRRAASPWRPGRITR